MIHRGAGLSLTVAPTVALAVAMTFWVAVAPGAHAAQPLPPPPALETLPAQTARPRTVIRAPEPPAMPKAETRSPAPAASAAPVAGDKPQPLPELEGDELPVARKVEREVKIDQIPRGAGITEIVVTPAFSTHSYTIINREGTRRAPQENQSSLSTPRFLRFDF